MYELTDGFGSAPVSQLPSGEGLQPASSDICTETDSLMHVPIRVW